MAQRKKKTTDLNYWLADGSRPVFVVDARRRLRAFNVACEELTGWSATDVVGETCAYASIADASGPAALAASLCPPPAAFTGSDIAAAAYIIHRDGQALSRLLQFFPLTDDTGAITAVLGLVSPLPAPLPRDESPARQLHAELAALRTALRTNFGSQSLVAQGTAMRRVLTQVTLAQHSGVGVLLTGPSGSGKEHLARVIHYGSAAKAGSFVPLDCQRLGAEELHRVWNRLQETLATGAGAAAPLPGCVLFSEVENLPRDLQERIVQSSGAETAVRLMAASRRSYMELAADSNLRPDFLALVSPLWIMLPSLAERPDDLHLLAQHFLEEWNRKSDRQLGGFDEHVWPLCTRYAWPGNLDELASVVAEAHARAGGPLIQVADLPYRLQTGLDAQALPPPREGPPLALDPLLTRVESRLIGLALERAQHNKSRAAELLGINRARLLRRIEQLGLGTGAATVPNEEPMTAGDAAEQAPPEAVPPSDLESG